MNLTFLVYIWLAVVIFSTLLAVILRRTQYKKPLTLEDTIVAFVGTASAISVVSLLVKLYTHQNLQIELGLDGIIIYLIGCGITLVISVREILKLF